jgi:lipopolysaccharide cholinephosphotransferase
MDYYVKSIIGAIADGIKALDADGILKNKKIILYGLDRNSFAMRTILQHMGYNVSGYISSDKKKVLETGRDIKDFACRFLNTTESLISVDVIEDRLVPFDDSVVILLVSETYEQEKEMLEKLGYAENVNFFCVYDFKDPVLDDLFKNKKMLSLPEIKKVETELLYIVDKICRENNLRYWVCAGTLLGTVRHGGFIPWDDDIDIHMPLDDYYKLLKLLPRDEYHDVIGMGASENYCFHDVFAKFVDKRTILEENIGTVKKINPLWVDIFPVIGVPEDEKERLNFFARYEELVKKIWEDFYAQDGDSTVFSKWMPEQMKFLEMYDFNKSKYVGFVGSAYSVKDYRLRSVYDKTLRMKFENIEVNVPGEYEECLVGLYGNTWMELPDESQRVQHNIKVYWV